MMSLPSTLRLLLLTAALWSSACVAVPGARLFARDKSCAADNFSLCGDDFPDYFCCAAGTRCLSLAGATTVVCCPNGAKCESLKPITCNIGAQDAKEDPQSPLKTTVLDVDLEKCGESGCCPFGYSCVDGDQGAECKMDRDQSRPPKKAGSPTSTAASPSTTTAGDATTEPTSSEASPTVTSDESKSESDSTGGKSGPDTAAIIGGVVGGIAALLIIAAILFICARRRAQSRPKSPEMMHGRNISDPISQPNMYRTEFMLRGGAYGSETDLTGQHHHQHHQELDGAPGPAAVGRKPSVRGFSSRYSLRRSRRRLSIPNHFANASPDPSCAETASRASTASYDNDGFGATVRTGRVAGARLAPIRSMKASGARTKSRHLRPEDAAADVDVFADPPPAVGGGRQQAYARETRFSDLMYQADLGDVQRGRPYVPTGTTPRI